MRVQVMIWCFLATSHIFDGSEQERRNSRALAIKLRFSCTNSSISPDIDRDYWPIIAPLGDNEFNTLRPRQNGRRFADDIFKCIFLNENVWIPIKISLKFVPQGPINNIPALVQIMAWRRPGDKPLSEPMMVRLPTHICVTRPQWVKYHDIITHKGLTAW